MHWLPPALYALFHERSNHVICAAALARMLVMTNALFVVAALARKGEVTRICRITSVAQRPDVFDSRVRFAGVTDEKLRVAVDALSNPRLDLRELLFRMLKLVERVVSCDD